MSTVPTGALWRIADALVLDGSGRTRSLRANEALSCPGVFLANAEHRL